MRIDNQSVDLLGPQGVKQRIAELQSRLDALSPNPKSSFQGMIESNMPGSMGMASPTTSGPLTAQNCLDPLGFSALNPMDPGTSLAPTSDLKVMIADAAKANGLEPELLEALVQTESNFNPGAVSRAGARGLTQLMPGTALGLGVKNVFDPAENLNGGAKYLAGQIKSFGNLKDALAAYNAGPARVLRGGVLPTETTRYVEKVMSLYEAKKSG